MLLRTQVETELGESAAIAEYREMFEAFCEDGQITDEERAMLVERQAELKLSAADVERVEAAVMARKDVEV